MNRKEKIYELGRVLSQQIDYEDNQVAELVMEEFRLSCLECTQFLEAVIIPKGTNNLESAQKAVDILDTLYNGDEIDWHLKSVYELSENDYEQIRKKREGYITFNCHISKIRANDFGHEFRCYLWLDNIGTGKGGWGYFIPDNPEAKAMVDIALVSRIDKKEIYVYGKLDEDKEKVRILELGLK